MVWLRFAAWAMLTWWFFMLYLNETEMGRCESYSTNPGVTLQSDRRRPSSFRYCRRAQCLKDGLGTPRNDMDTCYLCGGARIFHPL